MKNNLSAVNETNIGVYIALSFGVPIDDTDGHTLLIQSKRNDRRRIQTLIKTAKAYGFENVTVEFMQGVRPVSDDEYAVQQARMEAGMIPDTQELGTAIDDYKRGLAQR